MTPKRKTILGLILGLAVLFIGLSGSKGPGFTSATDITTLPDQVLLGTDTGEETGQLIVKEMKSLGLMPLEAGTYTYDYQVEESYILNTQSLTVKTQKGQIPLVANQDYAIASTSGGSVSGVLTDASDMDLFTLEDFSVFDKSFVLIDTRYYNDMAIDGFIDQITAGSTAKGFLLIVDNQVKLQQVIVDKNEEISVINIRRDTWQEICPERADSVAIHLETDVNPLGNTGYNIAGIYKGSDPFISDEALLIGMNYNYMTKEGREVLAFNLDLMKLLCSDTNKRSLIFMFFDGTMMDSQNGVLPMADDLPYSSQKIKAYMDLTKISSPNFDSLRFSTLQAPVTRQFAWSIGHHLSQEFTANNLPVTEPKASNYNGEYFFDNYYSDNTMFWDRGIATIHIGTYTDSPPSPDAKSLTSTDSRKHSLEELGNILLDVIHMNNY